MSLYLPICSVSGYYQLLFLRFSRAGHQQGNMMAVRSIHGNDHFLQWQSTHSFTPCQMPCCLLRRCQAIAILLSPRALNLLLSCHLKLKGWAGEFSVLLTWPRFPLIFRNARRFSLRARAVTIFDTLRLSAQGFNTNARPCFIPISVVFYCADVAPTELPDYYINDTTRRQ